jgi:hypothetical protein
MEVDFFLSKPFFFFLELLLLSDLRNFFFSDTLDFLFLDSCSVMRALFFLASALPEDLPFSFFEAAALDLLDLDFFEDSLDVRLRDSFVVASTKLDPGESKLW